MTQTPDRIWWNAAPLPHSYTSTVQFAGGAEYLRATPAREAASDLLEALEAALSYIEGEEIVMGSPCATGSIVRAAIAKAKGGAS